MWKFADDSTVSEVVPASKLSTLQQAADCIHDWSQENHLQLNPTKCKEIRTCFKRTPPIFPGVSIEGVAFETVSSAKVLGVTISSDLKWSAHIDSITTTAAQRLYRLRQLKCAGLAPSDLVLFYCSVIRSVLEYACQVFHGNLPLYLSDEIERIQRRALRIIFPACSYSEGLVKAGLPSSNIEQGDHKLSHLLPARSHQNYHLRSNRKFVVPVCKTNRYRDSFIIIQKFGFINGVDNVNWPPYRDSKS